MNTEESFILASLKEFVKLWGSGCQSSYHLECKNGQAWLQFGSALGSPGSQHFSPNVIVKDVPKKQKSPRRILKDRARAAAHRKATADANEEQECDKVDNIPDADSAHSPPSKPAVSVEYAELSNSAASVDFPAVQSSPQAAAPAILLLPTSVSDDEQSSVVPAELSDQHLITLPAASAGRDQDQQVHQVQHENTAQIKVPGIEVVHVTAVIEDSPRESITETDVKALENLILRETHLKPNIARLEIGENISRGFRNKRFKHTVQFLISVKTEKLWDSPRQYIWKHLGQLEWKKEDGTGVKFSRIHVK